MRDEGKSKSDAQLVKASEHKFVRFEFGLCVALSMARIGCVVTKEVAERVMTSQLLIVVHVLVLDHVIDFLRVRCSILHFLPDAVPLSSSQATSSGAQRHRLP